MEFVDYALDYARKGLSVFPLNARDKVPSSGLAWKKYQSTRPSEAAIRNWGLHAPDANIAIVTGEISGLFVVDCDTQEAFDSLQERGFDETALVQTGKGYHVYFAYPSFKVGNRAKVLPGVDIRGDGGYVVAPPSIHPSGVPYKWLVEHSPPVPLADAPDWLLSLLRPVNAPQESARVNREGKAIKNPDAYAAAALENEIASVSSAQTGERNNSLNRAAYNLGSLVADQFLNRSDVINSLLSAALSIGLNEKEALATIESGLSGSANAPRTQLAVAQPKSTPPPAPAPKAPVLDPDLEDTINFTDLGNTKRLINAWGDRIRFVSAWGRWLLWDSTRWANDETGGIMRAAKSTIISMYREASDIESDKMRRAFVKWALTSESRSKLESMVALAKTERNIAIKASALDANHWLLNTRNCTIDLRTWESYAHRQTDLITKRINVDFDPQATCPTWERFIERVMGGDEELIDFVRRAVGYSLTGSVVEQCLFFMIGTGKNGKSTFIETLLALMGEYCLKTPTETLMARDRSGIPNDVARLAGKRLVVARETDENQRLAEAVVKDLTGGDTITARFLHHEWFDFTPSHKLWMYGNHKPLVRGTDEGIWRRIRLIPFTVTITPEERDPDLGAKLTAELSGILNWALAGLGAWQRDGLNNPRAVREATAEYRAEMDVLAEFLDDCCIIDQRETVAAKSLYFVYQNWCDSVGERAMTQKSLGLRLKERGFSQQRTNRIRAWGGIKLVVQEQNP